MRWMPSLLWIVLLFGAGCRSGSIVPDDWAPAPDAAWQGDAHRDRQPRVQVLVCYDRLRSTHTALRVTTAEGEPVFWDPGGAYGLAKPEYGRVNDMVLDEPPTTAKWWEFRSRWMHEPFAYIFEWDLDPGQAQTMRDLLLEGAQTPPGDGRWSTKTTPGLCNIRICRFLQRHGSPVVDPPSSYLLPDGLAIRLWHQNPDRVLRYAGEYTSPPTVWLPPGDEPEPAKREVAVNPSFHERSYVHTRERDSDETP